MTKADNPGGWRWSVRLAIANSIGFSATTIMPLWIAALPGTLEMPAWRIGLIATVQLIACGLCNIASPWLLGRMPPLVTARIALAVTLLAGLCQAAALTPLGFGPGFGLPAFAAAALIYGAALGVLLGMTNRIMAGVDHVQKGYAIFQIVEVCFASSLYLTGATLLQHLGAPALFLLVAVVSGGGLLALWRLAVPEPISAVATAAVTGPSQRVRGMLLLLAMLCFFSGQSSINSFLIPIGHSIGLDAATVAHIVGGGMIFALVGATAARLLGERFGIAWPIVAAALLLAADVLFLTRAPSPLYFALAVAVIPIGTILVVPYFFTALARIDRCGRFAAIGPAFLIGGVALGPLISTVLNDAIGQAALGTVAAALLTLAGAIVMMSRGAR